MIWKIFSLALDGFREIEWSLAYHGWKNPLHNSTDDIGEISQEPYDNKLYTQTLGAAASEVFDNLR